MKKVIFMTLVAAFLAAACKKEDAQPDPVANFTISPNDTIPNGDAFTFNNTSTDAASYTWAFGDGGVSTATSPTKTYSGFEASSAYVSFDVTLTATRDDKTSSITKTVTVAMPR